jgi:hypothetical protein
MALKVDLEWLNMKTDPHKNHAVLEYISIILHNFQITQTMKMLI